MNKTYDNFRNIDVNKINPGNFVDKDRWTKSNNDLKQLKYFIDEMSRAANSNLDIPDILVNRVKTYMSRFVDFVNRIQEEKKGQPAEIATEKEQVLRELDGWFKECFEKVNNRQAELSFYETFNTLKNLEKDNSIESSEEIKKLKESILQDKLSIDTILKELQKKTATVTMSDYAKIFEKESNSHNLGSWIWLAIGVLLSLLFLFLLIFTNLYEKFPTEEILTDGLTVKYNISNLLVKLLMFAVQIFMISFSFKQYSISRHLQTINKHRQNGLDSFKLFVESINKEDTETRNSLMLQLAKAIYEQTATGYISDKNQNVNSGIVEITRMIGANKFE